MQAETCNRPNNAANIDMKQLLLAAALLLGPKPGQLFTRQPLSQLSYAGKKTHRERSIIQAGSDSNTLAGFGGGEDEIGKLADMLGGFLHPRGYSSGSVSELRQLQTRRTKARRRPNTLRIQRQHWQHDILPDFPAGTATGNLTRAQIQAWVDAGKDSPVQRNRAYATFRAAWNLAARQDPDLIPDGPSPFDGIELWPEQTGDRVMTDEELGRMWTWLGTTKGRSLARQTAAAAIAVIALTGARPGEIISMDWNEVDADTAVVHLEDRPGRKTGAKRIFLPPPACEILASVQSDPPRVFACSRQTLRRTWESMREDIGAADLTFHDLRRTHDTLLAEAGVPVEDVAALKQRSVATSARVYRKLRDTRLRELANLGADQMKGEES